jgi:hypothetical protein
MKMERDLSAGVGAELARPRRPKAARNAMAALRAAGPSKLGPYTSGTVYSRFSAIVVRSAVAPNASGDQR